MIIVDKIRYDIETLRLAAARRDKVGKSLFAASVLLKLFAVFEAYMSVRRLRPLSDAGLIDPMIIFFTFIKTALPFFAARFIDWLNGCRVRD